MFIRVRCLSPLYCNLVVMELEMAITAIWNRCDKHGLRTKYKLELVDNNLAI